MGFAGISFWLLQYAILLKVEALLATRASVLRILLWIILLVGIPFSVLHVCVIFNMLPRKTMYLEAVLLIIIMVHFAFFTILAARDTLRAKDLLCKARIDDAMRRQHVR